MIWILIFSLIGYLVGDSFTMILGGFLGFAAFVNSELSEITSKLSNIPQIKSEIEKLHESECSFLSEIKKINRNLQQELFSDFNRSLWEVESKISSIEEKLSDMHKKLFGDKYYLSTKSIVSKLSDIERQLSKIESIASSIERY